MKKWIILDRDGVINYDSENYIRSPAEWKPIPGSAEAIALLCTAGFHIAIATNQSGLARGYYDEAVLSAIHQKMEQCVASFGGKIAKICYCPHGPEANCLCRKPQPGLLHQIANSCQVSLPKTPFVGDSLRDIEAARAAQAKPILVLTGNGLKTQQKYAEQLIGVECYENLLAFAKAYQQNG